MAASSADDHLTVGGDANVVDSAFTLVEKTESAADGVARMPAPLDIDRRCAA